MVTIKVLESVSGIFWVQMDVSIQNWYMIEIMRRYFSQHHQIPVPISANQLGTIVMMSQIAEQVAMDCTQVPDSRGLAKPVNDFLFRGEKKICGEPNCNRRE